MNLTKLFNYQFFIQKNKKSRSGIIFSAIILPLFTLLSMLLLSSDNTSMVLDFSTLSIFNILFMYVIPIVLSISLFSYVYKKNSSDFVGSMPLSRRTIFTTNTIGGIFIIALIQIITMIIVLLTSMITNNLLVFGAMIWDIFIYFTISYIFVFIACNLAVSFSGNMFATIAATMLILFFVPFLLFTSRASSTWNAYSYYNGLNYEETNNIVFYDQFNFTAPSYFMDCMANSVEYEYNGQSLLKMVILSVAYFVIGLQLFKRKKFEMAEESYENENVHLIVKLLSLAPFFAVGVEGQVIESFTSGIFFFAVVATYYFLFDVITKKKIKLGKSILTFIAFSAIMYAIFALIVPHLDVITKRELSIDDIKSVTIKSISTNYGNSILTNLEIDDKNLIYGMLSNLGSTDNYYSGFNGADLAIKTQNGEYFINRADIPNFKKIMDKYGNEKYELNIDNYKISLGGAKLTKEDTDVLRKAIKTDLDSITYNRLYNILKGDREIYSLTATSYINHKIIINNYNASEMKNICNATIKILNKSAYKHSTEYDFTNMTYMPDFREYIIKKNPDVLFDDYEEYDYKTPIEVLESGEEYKDDWVINITDVIFDGLRNIGKDDLREYLYEHKDDEFDKTKPYFSIWFVTTDGGFYSNDLKGFYKIFAKTFNERVSNNYGIKLNED